MIGPKTLEEFHFRKVQSEIISSAIQYKGNHEAMRTIRYKHFAHGGQQRIDTPKNISVLMEFSSIYLLGFCVDTHKHIRPLTTIMVTKIHDSSN